MKMIVAVVRPEKYEDVKEALKANGIMGMTITHVTGRGAQAGVKFTSRVGDFTVDELEKIKMEAVVEDSEVDKAVETIRKSACTGHSGDGRIFVLPVEATYKISDYNSN
ncbi:MAG: P-II family nitrogen regulator [archaeon]|nr:P-II family nitrogen regulator [archaeon]